MLHQLSLRETFLLLSNATLNPNLEITIELQILLDDTYIYAKDNT